MATTFRSIAQLKNQTWPSREAAVAELKRNAYQGEVAETKPGSTVWIVTGELTKGKAKKPHPADVAAEEKVSKATSYAIHMRLSPDKRMDETRANLAEAIQLAQKWNAEHGHNGRRATVYAMVEDGGPGEPVKYDTEKVSGILRDIMKIANCDKEMAARLHTAIGIAGLDFSACTQDELRKAVLAAMKGERPEKPNGGPAEKPPEPEEPDNDMASLPAAEGPYTMQLADQTAQHSIVTDALSFSRKVGVRIAIISKAGKVVRVMDGRLGGKKPTRTATKTAARVAKGPKGESKQGRALDLLCRPNGATAKELVAVTDWPIGQRHINKLAKVFGKKIEQLGDQRWKLV